MHAAPRLIRSVPDRARGSRLRLIPLLAALPLTVGGCANLGRIQVFHVSIVNDTASPVVVRNCDSFCSSSLLAFDLQPGGSVPVNRTTNDHDYWSVTTPTGGHIGCVDLFFRAPQPGASVPVSGAGPCPGPGVPWLTIAVVTIVALPIAAWGFRLFLAH
jgi:hypothetical protein